MKALSFLMGQRRVHVPRALSREIVEAICGVVNPHSVEEMTALSMLVADFVWGGRAADLYLTDWSELVFEFEMLVQCAQAMVEAAGPATVQTTATEPLAPAAVPQAQEEEKRVIGVTWKRLQTKNDRQGKKDAPKPLQCCSGCDGTLKLTEEKRFDGIPCPVT